MGLLVFIQSVYHVAFVYFAAYCMKRIEIILTSLPIVCLTALTIGAVSNWQYTHYLAYSFFISWSFLFIFHIATLRNYHSLILLGLAGGAAGLYFNLTAEVSKAEAALLLGKIAITVFAAALAIRLYKNRESLENASMVFIGLVILLLLQAVTQTVQTNEHALEAVSVTGFAHYFTTGLIAHILLNDTYSSLLTKGEQKVLMIQVVFCLYNISLLLISNFV